MTSKVEKAITLMQELSSGIQVVKGKEGHPSTNNLYPLLDILEQNNFNVVELGKIVHASRFLPESIYHPNAEVNEEQLGKREVLDFSSTQLQEKLMNAEEGAKFKVGTNGVYSNVIKDLVNQAYRKRAVQYVADLVEEQINKIEEKVGGDKEEYTELKRSLVKDISKPIREYSLFRELKPEEILVDAKQLAKSSVLDNEMYFEKAYTVAKGLEGNEIFAKKKKASVKP